MILFLCLLPGNDLNSYYNYFNHPWISLFTFLYNRYYKKCNTVIRALENIMKC